MSVFSKIQNVGVPLFAAAAAAVSQTAGMPGWQGVAAVAGGTCVATTGMWLADKVKQHHVHDHVVPTVHQPEPDKPVWEVPTTDSWCQYCDDLHPTKEFSLDILGRWVCLKCRRDVEPDYEPPSAAPPTPPNGIPAQSVECVSCRRKTGTFFVKLADGEFVHMCQPCLGEMTQSQELLEQTRKRLDAAEKKPARRGSTYVKDPTFAAEPKPNAGKPPCAVCGAPSYYYLAIAGGSSEHRCVRCSAAPRKYTPEEQKMLMLAAKQDQINQLAAIHEVPPPLIGHNPADEWGMDELVGLQKHVPLPQVKSRHDQITQTAEVLASRFRLSDFGNNAGDDLSEEPPAM
jgi:hypothetical protein